MKKYLQIVNAYGFDELKGEAKNKAAGIIEELLITNWDWSEDFDAEAERLRGMGIDIQESYITIAEVGKDDEVGFKADIDHIQFLRHFGSPPDYCEILEDAEGADYLQAFGVVCNDPADSDYDEGPTSHIKVNYDLTEHNYHDETITKEEHHVLRSEADRLKIWIKEVVRAEQKTLLLKLQQASGIARNAFSVKAKAGQHLWTFQGDKFWDDNDDCWEIPVETTDEAIKEAIEEAITSYLE